MGMRKDYSALKKENEKNTPLYIRFFRNIADSDTGL